MCGAHRISFLQIFFLQDENIADIGEQQADSDDQKQLQIRFVRPLHRQHAGEHIRQITSVIQREVLHQHHLQAPEDTARLQQDKEDRQDPSPDQMDQQRRCPRQQQRVQKLSEQIEQTNPSQQVLYRMLMKANSPQMKTKDNRREAASFHLF